MKYKNVFRRGKPEGGASTVSVAAEPGMQGRQGADYNQASGTGARGVNDDDGRGLVEAAEALVMATAGEGSGTPDTTSQQDTFDSSVTPQPTHDVSHGARSGYGGHTMDDPSFSVSDETVSSVQVGGGVGGVAVSGLAHGRVAVTRPTTAEATAGVAASTNVTPRCEWWWSSYQPIA